MIKLFAGFVMVGALFMAAVIAPFAPFVPDPYATDLSMRLQPPGAAGVLGTDHLGRDVLSRFLHGARLSAAVSLVTLGISLFWGLVLGLLAGYFRRCDRVIMFVVNVLLAFPGMILSLAIVGIAGGGVVNAVIAVSLVSWIGYARMVRSIAMSLKEQDFVAAARALGAGDFRVIFRHILPNLMNPVIIYSAANISLIMMQLAALSFLGLGVQPPAAEWGAMLNDARGYIALAPWLIAVPGMGLVFMISGFNLLSEGLTWYFDRRRL